MNIISDDVGVVGGDDYHAGLPSRLSAANRRGLHYHQVQYLRSLSRPLVISE